MQDSKWVQGQMMMGWQLGMPTDREEVLTECVW